MDKVEEEKRLAERAYRETQGQYANKSIGADAYAYALMNTQDCEVKREPVQTLIERRAKGLRNESALYDWLIMSMARNPVTPEVEQELYNLLTSGYRPRAY